jgi:hypothetical protein
VLLEDRTYLADKVHGRGEGADGCEG